MGDEHDGAPLGSGVAQQAEHDLRRSRVQVAGGLVGQQDGRVAHQRPGDGEALLLAAGQLVRPTGRGVGQAEACNELLCAMARAERRTRQP